MRVNKENYYWELDSVVSLSTLFKSLPRLSACLVDVRVFTLSHAEFVLLAFHDY